MTSFSPTDFEGDLGAMVLLDIQPAYKTMSCERCETREICRNLAPEEPVLCEIPDEFDMITNVATEDTKQ